jgi:tricorn protease interacting factor F2/3
VDNGYAEELAPQFEDFQKVEPDMKQAVALAYARSGGNYHNLVEAYREGKLDEDKVRFLNAMTAFRDESLLKQTLEFALSGEVKKQDVRTVILAATEKPAAQNATWIWLKENIGKIRSLYQNTGILSGTLLSVIPILGIGRTSEVEDFFNKQKIPEAAVGIKAGLEKLRVYDRLVTDVSKSR